jgi:hypothetical protein
LQQLSTYPYEYLLNESYSLLARLGQLDPFSMTMPMVRGAAVSDKALKEITELLEKGKIALRKNIHSFIDNIQPAHRQKKDSRELQTGFTILKLRFNSILDQLDIFADVLSQRSEHEVGVWLSGLDVLAEDGLMAVKPFAELPSLMVYLDRGHGAAIRRARTKLPGGDENPVAVIQMPRERMVGSGIAASLIHEVGHQAAALLDLVASLKKMLLRTAQERSGHPAWKYFEKWISEIICDVWAMGHLGIASTVGLMGVVTLPRYFQFRLNLNDPHPAPYVRVYLSYVFGKTLFPHPQWDKIWNMWKDFYPLDGLDQQVITILRDIENEADQFAKLVLSHSTKEMKGKKLSELFFAQQRNPANLQALYRSWMSGKTNLNELAPTLVFAALGQAKADMAIEATNECTVLIRQLKYWAYTRK